MNSRQVGTWVTIFALLVVVAFRVIDTGGGGSSSGSSNSQSAGGGKHDDANGPRAAKVIRAVDGDTILVRLTATGRTERVRYIGVDTPESVKPNTPVQCYAKIASHYNQSRVAGKSVKLVPDREPRDKYGRALAFVYIGSDLINADLLRGGYARTLEIEPNTSKASQFAALERVAINANKGLWGNCDR